MGNYADASLLCIGNDHIELKIDCQTGFFIDIYNKETGIHHKESEVSGVWPLGLRMGTPQASNLIRAEINGNPLSAKQKMTYNTTSENGCTHLDMLYGDLLSTGGNPTGVALTIHVKLKQDADYFLITSEIENKGEYDITRIFSGWGGLVADTRREGETLAVPDWSFGSKRRNPHKTFPNRSRARRLL